MFNKKRCVNGAKWRGYILYCPKCGERIAYRYLFDGEVRVVVLQGYRKYIKEIKEREDNKEVTGDGDVVGSINFHEFDEFCDNIRQTTRELFSLSEDEGGVYEDSEGEDSDGVGGISFDDEAGELNIEYEFVD